MNILKKICRWLQKHLGLFIIFSCIIGIALVNVSVIIGLKAQIKLVWLIVLTAGVFAFLFALFAILFSFIKNMKLGEVENVGQSKGTNETFLNIITLGIYPIAKTMAAQKRERELTGKTLDDYTFIDRLHMSSNERKAVTTAKLLVKIGNIFKAIIMFIPNLFVKLWKVTKRCFSDLAYSMKHGDAFTRLNFLFLGSVNVGHGQIGHGIVLFLYQILYFFYLFFDLTGIRHIIGLFTLGTQTKHDVVIGEEVCTEVFGTITCYTPTKTVPGDDSALFLLWGVLGVLLLIVYIAVYLSSNRSSIKLQEKYEEGRPIQTFSEELKDYTNSKFHRLLLALPLLGVFLFSILPLIDMILMAFTNYDMNHQTPANLFDWTGFETFNALFNSSSLSSLFWPILWWTIIWAILATVTNYFFGIIMALLINKKSIKLKKLWRTALVLSIAVPQFVSLLAMNKFLSKGGYLNQILSAVGFYDLGFVQNIFGKSVAKPISDGGGIDWLSNFGTQAITIFGKTHKVLLAKPMIIIVNLWIGIPYSVLSNTGILMNIPADLYESARIDGASNVKQFFKITLPYILFVTMPSTITSFIGNINNFNVIFFLTGGGPTTGTLEAGKTDLLVTWLYKLTVNKNYFNLASVIGILTFIFCTTIGLIMYKNSKSVKDEEAFM